MRDQTHIWARQYDCELSDLLAVEGEIAQETADEIQLTLGDHKSAAVPAAALSPQRYDAYDLYLNGQYFLQQAGGSGLRRSHHIFPAGHS